MLRGVLFDLDGTLLDLDLESFLAAYFSALETVCAERFPGVPDMLAAVTMGTGAMMDDHPGRTNREVFYEDFRDRTGVDLEDHWEVFETFYRERFPGLGTGSGPAPGARLAVETAIGLGLRVAIATNPIFPRSAIEHRLAWAGLSDLGLEVLTTYEVMHACKPWPAYFRQAAGMLDLEPGQCIMVGDDPVLDLSAADVGMRTFYVGQGPGVADYRGGLDDLAALLERLTATDAAV